MTPTFGSVRGMGANPFPGQAGELAIPPGVVITELYVSHPDSSFTCSLSLRDQSENTYLAWEVGFEAQLFAYHGNLSPGFIPSQHIPGRDAEIPELSINPDALHPVVAATSNPVVGTTKVIDFREHTGDVGIASDGDLILTVDTNNCSAWYLGYQLP